MHFKDLVRLEEIRNKWTIEPLEIENGSHIPKKRDIFHRSKLKKKNLTTKLIQIQNTFKVRKRESGYFKSKTMPNVNFKFFRFCAESY